MCITLCIFTISYKCTKWPIKEIYKKYISL